MKNALLTMAVAAACFSYGAQADEKTGGDIVVTYQNDVATLDPAIGYDWQNGTVAKLAMRQPFVLFKGLTFQKLCLP
ncbi:hypothetical protein AAGP56_26295, partial [Klebsiella pneumoniae]